MSLILVIEDEPDLQEEVADILMFDGYDVITADNGKQGIEQAQKHRPHLIVCDIMMPGIDGYTVLETLQESPATDTIPFIFLTAKATIGHIREGMNLGADDYLTKPFEHRDLLLAVETRLSRSSAYQESSDRKAQKQREQLVQHIATELKKPLMGMQLATNLVEQYIGTDVIPNLDIWLDAYYAGSNRLDHLIEQLVLETGFESGSLTHDTVRKNAQSHPLWAIVTGAVELGRKFARENHQLDVHLNFADEGLYVACELKLLQHAIAEVIANAIDFSPIDQPLTIEQWQSDDMLNLSITDKGVGMSDGQIKYALMPFKQASHIKTATQGLGLGLSLAKRIVQLHGGLLKVLSTEDNGTTVLIRLPYM